MKISRLMSVLTILLVVAALTSGCASSGAGGSAAPAAPPAPMIPAEVGSWTVTIDTPAGTQTPTLTIAGTEGALTGSFSGPAGDTELSEVMVTDGTLTFSVEIDAGGQMISLTFSGMVDGDSLTGTFGSDFGDFPATGVRN